MPVVLHRLAATHGPMNVGGKQRPKDSTVLVQRKTVSLSKKAL